MTTLSNRLTELGNRIPKTIQVVASGLLLLFYLVCSMTFSRHKPLWGDETYGLEASVRVPSVRTLLVQGAPFQGSPAPLYYLVLKAYVPYGGVLIQKGLSEAVVWRWPTLGFLLGGAVIFLWRHRKSDPILALGMVLLLVFSKEVFYYASEARPYGLWLITSFLFLDAFWKPYSTLGWYLVCFCLGATATASVFLFSGALGALALSPLLSSSSPRRDLQFYLGIVLGMGVSFYYALHAGQWGFNEAQWGTWSEFLRFEFSYKWPLLGSLYFVWKDYRDPHRGDLGFSLILFIWFAMGPMIYFITRHQGCLYSERHYIYWSAVAVMVVGRLSCEKFQGPQGWLKGLLLLLCMKRLDLVSTALRMKGSGRL